MRGIRFFLTAALAGTLALVPGSALHAAGLLSDSGSQEIQESKLQQADRLESMAMELLSQCDMETWEPAAELLERSARLRAEASPARFNNLKKAANLFHWIGSNEHARDLFEEAADQARQGGDLVFAANAYLDAAVLSAQLRMGRHTIAAARMANQLAGSEGVPQADRVVIAARLQELGLPLHLGQIL